MMASLTSVFDRMTEEEIVNFVKENGLPAVQELGPLPDDIDRLVDLIEKHFKVLQMPAEEPQQQQQQSEPEIVDEKEAEAAAAENSQAQDADQDDDEERRLQKAAWERIRNKGVIPIAFGGDQNQPPAQDKRKVLFVCKDNSCLSQMAEAWTFKLFHNVLDVASAGLTAAASLHELAISTMMFHDMDICSWKTKSLADVRDIAFDIVCPLDEESRAVVEKMDWKKGQVIGGKFEVPSLDGREELSPQEIQAMIKARRAFRELERRQQAGEDIDMDTLLKEPGLEERLAAMDADDAGDAAAASLDPKVRLVPEFRRLGAELVRFVEHIPTILAFMNHEK